MSKLALIILVLAVFLIIVLLVVFGIRPKDKLDENTVKVHLDKNSAVNIYKDEESAIRIEYVSFEDRPRAFELFPDLLSDLPKQEGALNREFWDKFLHFKDLPFEEQKEMEERLRVHGFVGPNGEYSIELPPVIGPDGGEKKMVLPPDPSDEDAYNEFFRPFTDN